MAYVRTAVFSRYSPAGVTVEHRVCALDQFNWDPAAVAGVFVAIPKRRPFAAPVGAG